jgi:AcrR family transcriptional regulator
MSRKFGGPSGSRLARSAASRPNRRERHRSEMRGRIFRAALELFAERGFLQTTVEDITEAADVGKGTFFNYFPTKEHVLAQYGEERIQRLERVLESVRERNESALDALKGLATDLAGQSSESPDLLRAVFAAHLSCAPVLAGLQKRIQVARELLEQIFALGQERGEIRRDQSPAELGRLMRLIFMGVTVAWAINPEGTLPGTAAEVWALIYPSLATSAGPRLGSGAQGAKRSAPGRGGRRNFES